MQALASFAAFLTAAGTSLLCLVLASLAVLGYVLVGALLIAGEDLHIIQLLMSEATLRRIT